MEEIVINELTHEGMRRVRVVGDAPFAPPPAPPQISEVRGVFGEGGLGGWERVVPPVARDRIQMEDGHDEALGIYWMELTWPAFEPYEIFTHGLRKFRRLMVVNYVYAERVSECIELARVEFFARTHFAPQYAFARELPQGADDGMDVHGCMLFAAEWMPAQCAAVGGRG